MTGAKLRGMEKPAPIPADRTYATPYLIVRDAAKALEFYQRAFRATETVRMAQPDGKIVHAELSIGKAQLMLADEFPGMGYVGPQTLGGTSVSMHIYVEDVDAFVKHAEAEGAKVLRPVSDQFYGDRMGALEDPFGHRWSFSSRIEELTHEQMQERAAQYKGE
ncbi:MAG: Glyoxalase/bleomycin resistance protein/dioxygenase [Myxococcaceae bacterium]|nr:Glyoxalase/bleomycin resistance protein/dioxygenase [Myxococcaceae bacterium]